MLLEVTVCLLLASCSIAYKIGVLADSDVVIETLTTYDGYTAGVDFQTHKLKVDAPLETINKVCELLHLGYGGFISFVDCLTAQAIDLLAKQRNIPNIMYTEQPCSFDKSTASFHLLSSCSELNTAIADIVMKLNYLEALVLYDKSLGATCMSDLILRLSKQNVRSRLLKVDLPSIPPERATNMLRKYNPGLIIALLEPRSYEHIYNMDWLQEFSSSTWVFGSQEIVLPAIFNGTTTAEQSNILLIRPFYNQLEEDGICLREWPVSAHNHTMLTDFLIDAKTVFLRAINNIKSVLPGYSFERFDCSSKHRLPTGKLLSDEIERVTVKGLTGTIGWTKDKHPIHSQYQLCSVRNNSKSYHHMGKWTNKNGLTLDNGVLFGNEFTDFGGRTIVVSTVQVEPFITVEEVNNISVYSGFCFDILDEMARIFNFSYRVVLPPDGQYGSPRPDGSWTGMIGMILDGEIDFAVAPFTITSIRESVIDFTVPIMEDGVGILTKKVTEEPYKIFKTLKPFTPKVWGAIGIVIIVVGFLLYFINRVSPYTVDGQDFQVDTAVQQKKLKSNIWVIYGSFLEQAVDPRPSATSGRVMLGFWWIFTILMLATYTANLAAYLTVSITVQPINSLTELVAQDKIKPLVKAGTSLHTLFQTANSGVYTKVWSKMASMPYVTSRADAVELTRTGEYAFMTDISQLEYIQLQNCADFALADEVFNQAGLGFVMAENAPFKNAFNLNLMKMHEAGMMERWKEKWWPKVNTCTLASRTGGAKPLDMDSIAGLFYLYFGVVAIAVLVLIMTILYQRVFQRYQTCLLQLKNQIMWVVCHKRRENLAKNDSGGS